jgi:hypothetical protein
MFAPAAISKAGSRCRNFNLLLYDKQPGFVVACLLAQPVTLGFKQRAGNPRFAMKHHDMSPTFQNLLFICA